MPTNQDRISRDPNPFKNNESRPGICTKNRPAGRSDLWPTLVMQTGYSQSAPKLASDAEWWLTASEGDVRTALVVSVHRKRPEIVIEKWGALQTGASPTVQRLVVSRLEGGRGGWMDAVVSNGPLVLSFEDLFLREPACGEDDVWLMDSDLREMADMVWEGHIS